MDNSDFINQAFSYAKEKATELNCPLKFVRAEKKDDSPLTFFFESEARVDFRELVKQLNTYFGEPIRLEQIGARDVCKQIGGIGVCGQTTCCHKFLKEFKSITNELIKVQGLNTNLSQYTGLCGKLMCCLYFECPKEKLAQIKTKIDQPKAKLAQRIDSTITSDILNTDHTPKAQLAPIPTPAETVPETVEIEETEDDETALLSQHKNKKKHKNKKQIQKKPAPKKSLKNLVRILK